MSAGLPITVAFISHSSLAYGAERSLATLVNNLPSSIRPILIAPGDGPFQGLLKKSIPFYRARFIPWLSRRKRPVKSLIIRFVNGFASTGTAAVCKKEHVSIIYSNTLATPIGYRIASMLRVPHVVHAREFVGRGEAADFAGPDNRTWKMINDSLDLLICNSRSVAQFYKGKVPETKIRTIYNGIDVKKIGGAARKINTIVSVGKIEERKNQSEIIEAVSLLAKRGIIVNVTFAGGAERSYLKKLTGMIEGYRLEKQVHFTGPVEDPVNLYAENACLVHAARREPWGRVVVEAMLQECPVIAAECDGVTEIIMDGSDGLLYPPGNPGALASCIEQVLKGTVDTASLVKNAKMKAGERFTVERYVDEIACALINLKTTSRS